MEINDYVLLKNGREAKVLYVFLNQDCVRVQYTDNNIYDSISKKDIKEVIECK